MKALRATSVVTLVAWMCGSLFALWLVLSAKTTAMLMASIQEPAWTGFLTGVPWILVWVVVVAVLAALAWGATFLAKTAPWAAYAYAVLVVGLLAILYWAAVVMPPSSMLALPL